MELGSLSSLKQRLPTGKNRWPSIGAGNIGRVVLGAVHNLSASRKKELPLPKSMLSEIIAWR
jgi:hypothetical protein